MLVCVFFVDAATQKVLERHLDSIVVCAHFRFESTFIMDAAALC